MARSIPLAAVAALFALSAPSRADAVASPHFAAWQVCLTQAFTAEGPRASRSVAADAALLACRAREDAYLAALAASPLLDGEDVARARPALVTRVRARLMGVPLARFLDPAGCPGEHGTGVLRPWRHRHFSR